MKVTIAPGKTVTITRTANRIVRTGAGQAIVQPAQTRVIQRGGPTLAIHGPGLQGVQGEQGLPGDKGDTGEQGLPGSGGGGLASIERSFASPSTSWTWTHNLNSFAIEVNCFEPDGLTEKDAYPIFLDANTVQIDWFYPETGVVRILY